MVVCTALAMQLYRMYDYVAELSVSLCAAVFFLLMKTKMITSKRNSIVLWRFLVLIVANMK